MFGKHRNQSNDRMEKNFLGTILALLATERFSLMKGDVFDICVEIMLYGSES